MLLMLGLYVSGAEDGKSKYEDQVDRYSFHGDESS